MRVLHVIVSVDATHGGPPIIASRIAAAQAALGHEAGLVSYEPKSEKTSIPARLNEIPGGKDVKVHLIPRQSKGEGISPLEMLFSRKAKETLREVVPGYDFLHLNGVWEPFLLAAAKEARRAGKPYCVLTHGMLDPWTLTQNTHKKKIALALGIRRMLNNAAFLHLGNKDEQELIRPLRLTAPTEIIPNGVFIEEFENLPPKGTFHSKHPELKGQPFILFLSRLHYKKGLDYLADAFAIVAKGRSDIRLVVAGSDDGYKVTFEQMIESHGLKDRTHLVGGLYGVEKLAAFNDAACFCLPSRQEGFSIAITESLACGTPSVVTRDCHYPEVGDVGAGAVTSLDARSVADGILHVLSQDREKLGEAGKHLIRTRFTWPIVAKMTIDAYQRAMRSTPASRAV